MDRFMQFEQCEATSLETSIAINDVLMPHNETSVWVFSGLNVRVSQSNLSPIKIRVQTKQHTVNASGKVKNPNIVIYNSSFESLDLKPGTNAQITDCYVDAVYDSRPTLITANNARVLIQNSTFERCVNENGSTALLAQNNSQTTIENSLFRRHNSSMGIFLLADTCTLNMTYSTIAQNVAFSAGFSPITLYEGSQAAISGSTFTSNSAMKGGALTAEGGCRVKISNCTFSSNTAVAGGALSLTKNTTLDTNGCSFESNQAVNDTFIETDLRQISIQDLDRVGHGGSIYASNSTINLNNDRFRDNRGISGGVIYQVKGSVAVLKSNFLDTNATKDGGAIKVDNGHLTVKDSLFEHNTASSGGAIAGAGKTIVNFNNATFTLNRAEVYGGSIFVNFSTENFKNSVYQASSRLDLRSCLFEKNSALEFGGAIAGHNNGVISIDRSTFIQNKVNIGRGGAIHAKQIHLEVQNTRFTGNRALNSGGAIGGELNVKMAIRSCTFEKNEAGTGAASSSLRISSVHSSSAQRSSVHKSISKMKAIFNHSPGNNFDQEQHAVEKSMTPKHSAAIDSDKSRTQKSYPHRKMKMKILRYRSKKSMKMLANGDLIENVDRTGGNVGWASGGAVCGMFSTTMEIHESNFTGNTADQGGGVHAQFQSQLTLTGCSFYDNSVSYVGGALLVGSMGLIQGSLFVNNSATAGGAVHGDNGASVHIQGSNFTGNTASRSGGAVEVQTGFLSMTDCVLRNNSASYAGGAAEVSFKALFLATNTSFVDNTATYGGGAIIVTDNVVVNISHSNFVRNRAPNGAGLEMDRECEAHLMNSVFYGNYAEVGGAVDFGFKTTLEVHNSSFINNTAGNAAPAIFVGAQSKAKVVYSVLKDNAAKSDGGAVTVSEESSLDIRDSDVTGNHGDAGGAIYVSAQSSLRVENCRFSNNSANQRGGAILAMGTSAVKIYTSNFSQNTATEGGVLYTTGETEFSLTDAVLLNNVVSGYGGALSLELSTKNFMDGITCVGNQANDGGCLSLNAVTLTLRRSNISGNSGSTQGAAIYMDNSNVQVSKLPCATVTSVLGRVGL